jgi:hypothetical protein
MGTLRQVTDQALVTDDRAIQARYLVVDDFMPGDVALAMRKAIEDHFGHPHRHSQNTHMIWNYWHVAGLYTYFRTLPEKLLGSRLTESFQSRLSGWSADTLGLLPGNSSYLSLYVHGCRQGQHNDSANGRFGFVYSLTRDLRKTSGGETLIWREEDYWQTRMARPCAGEDFFEAIEPRFNRLLVFDDRVPHAVQLVEGNMDPLEGRMVIHGHIREAGPIVCGPLQQEAVREIGNQLVAQFARELGDALRIYHGPAAVRFTVRTDGAVADARVILDRVRRLRGEGPKSQEMLAGLVRRVSALRFPEGTQETTITIPFAFG